MELKAVVATRSGKNLKEYFTLILMAYLWATSILPDSTSNLTSNISSGTSFSRQFVFKTWQIPLPFFFIVRKIFLYSLILRYTSFIFHAISPTDLYTSPASPSKILQLYVVYCLQMAAVRSRSTSQQAWNSLLVSEWLYKLVKCGYSTQHYCLPSTTRDFLIDSLLLAENSDI
jgi:hypothetical protein